MRTRLSVELQAHARRLFEQTDQPGTEIAADCGVDESTIRRLAEREGWVRFVAPPRDLPPVAKLLAEVEALEASLSDRHPEVRGLWAEPRRIDAKLSQESAVALRGAQERAPQGDGEKTPPTPDPSPPLVSLVGGGEKEESGAALSSAAPSSDADEQDTKQRIAEFEQTVMGYVREFDAERKNGRLLPTERLAVARAINTLTDTFNKLQRMRANLPGSIHDDHAYDMPADLDAFRDDLARQIEAFMESRPDEDDAKDDSAAQTGDVS
jgi:hypothetical protein